MTKNKRRPFYEKNQGQFADPSDAKSEEPSRSFPLESWTDSPEETLDEGIDATVPYVEVLVDIPKTSDVKVEVLIERLNFRDAPNMSGKILFPAKKGDIFLTDGVHFGDWLSVRVVGEKSVDGFVIAKYVKEVSNEQHPQHD